MSALWLLVNLMTIAEPDDVPESLAARAGGTTRIEAGRSDEQAPGDRRDLVLFLDGGPLHFRVRFALGGQSLVQSRKAYIDRLMAILDADGDGKLTRKEAARSPLFRTKSRPSANSFLEGLQNQSAMTRREVEQRIEAKGNNLVSYHDHVSSSKNDREVFSLLDRDGSGVLDTAELLAAAELIVSKDTDGDQCVSFEEFVPPPPPPDPM